MSVKSSLAALLHPIEKRFDRLTHRRRQAGTQVIEPYDGYETPEGVILRGRVLSELRRGTPKDNRGWFDNLREMLSLFLTSEVAQVRVATVDGGIEAISDEEGYFTLVISDATAIATHVDVHLPARPDVPPVSLPVYRALPGAEYGVISDIDDTMLETGAYSLARNLWTSMTGNALTRRVFPDAVALMQKLHDDRNPVFYVSSSPWNLFDFLQQIFRRHGLVMGPMFLRDLGISSTQFVTGTHGDHKGAAIDTILAANPDLPFVLIGDTSQHDAHVYLHAIQRHPGRITRVILRQPGPGPDAKSLASMEAIRAAGVRLDSAPDYSKLL
ncbi:phosphatase domain-containing protein [Roseovarius sp. 2305UL8-3]|uniref:phosphatase domain-containing protein n=1 Tax=Roseovarius conchicola TaxID=3121636 RepID=UPI003528EC0F